MRRQDHLEWAGKVFDDADVIHVSSLSSKKTGKGGSGVKGGKKKAKETKWNARAHGTAAKLKRELEAQKARAEALQYLAEKGCGPMESRTQDGANSRSVHEAHLDNTIGMVRSRQAREIAMAGGGKDAIKERLLKAQQEFAAKLQARARGESGSIFSRDMPGDEWEETVDAQSGDTYYWNRKTNETSWQKPETEKPKKIAFSFKSNKHVKAGTDAGARARRPTAPPWRPNRCGRGRTPTRSGSGSGCASRKGPTTTATTARAGPGRARRRARRRRRRARSTITGTA